MFINKDFFKKYKLIILLTVVVITLALIRIYSGTQTQKETEKNKTTPTPTSFLGSNEDLFQQYQELETVEEKDAFLEKLTVNERDYVLAEEPSEEDNLKEQLPYEETDFKVIKFIKEGVLLVETKISDKDKAKESLKKWLSDYETTPGENIIVWQ